MNTQSDENRTRVYGQIMFNVTPENADQVEEDIQLELLGLQDEGGRLPFFLMVFMYNQITGEDKHYLIRYNYDSLRALLDTVRDPSMAWENYRNGAYDIDSDTKVAMADMSPEERDGEPIEVYQLTQIGLYHPNFAVDMSQEDREVLYADFPEMAHFPRDGKGFTRAIGRFMRYRFNYKYYEKLRKERHDYGPGCYQGSEADKIRDLFGKCFDYWVELIGDPKNNDRVGEMLELRYQIPWFTKDKPLKEDEEGQEPIISPIYKIPCALYALKGQISNEHWDELNNQPFIHKDGVKTDKIRKFLNEKGYQLIKREIKQSPSIREQWKQMIRARNYDGAFNEHNREVLKIYEKVFGSNEIGCPVADEVESATIETTTHKYPSKGKNMKPVEIDFWEGHWMKHYKDNPHFLLMLEKARWFGLVKPFNGFEYYQAYDNYAVDAMIGFDDQMYIANHPNEYQFTEIDYEKPEYKDRNGFTRVMFADFEASTKEEGGHVPYLVCAEEYETKLKNGKMEYIYKQKYDYWGRNCGEALLKEILIKYGQQDCKKKTPSIRVYFHNLKYDFTFLFPYLSDIKAITKGGRLYSAKCCYKCWGKRVYIDFWDSYPVFQTKLKNAVTEYLSENERKELNIQKEVFPYDFYTYKMFDRYSTGWINVVEAKDAFKEPGEYEEFLLNLKKTLPFIPDNYLNYTSEMCEQNETKMIFNYKEYAIFYCMQDVRCLATIIKKFSNLLLGTGVEGVNGTPPFSMNLLAYRTASSIGFDYFLKTVMFKQNGDKDWIPRHDWAVPKCALRALIQKTIRGGRVMTRDNEKCYYKATGDHDLIQDYDAVSLYPSAMSILWLTDGVPKLIKGKFDEKVFLSHFAPPEATSNNAKAYLYQDGCVHLTHLNTKKTRHFPLLCVKGKDGLNNYRNFADEDVDTWVNAIDLFNLIEFQDAEFAWDAAVVWTGERHYEIRDSIKALFQFRLENHKTIKDASGKVIEKIDHPIQKVAKLMMNSIFGKSILKVSDKEKKIVSLWRWRKTKTGQWEKMDNWEEFFKANLYRIHRIDPISETQTEVEIYKRDVSASMNIFGSNVLAMARRIIGRVMALVEDVEEKYPNMSPGLFYTDTDSMHIRTDLLKLVEIEFSAKYRRSIRGEEMGTFHIDFDPMKGGEKVKGANESWFIAKKMYADRLVGVNGGIDYHLRMKGIPNELIKYEYYEKIYNDIPFTFDLLCNNRVSFYYEHGKVCSRDAMTRTVMTKAAKEKMLAEKGTLKRARSQSANGREAARKKAKRTALDELNIDTSEEDEYLPGEQVLLNPPKVQEYYDARKELHQEIVIGDEGDTVLLPLEPPSEQDEPINEDDIIDILED